jgi:hypothetical protein
MPIACATTRFVAGETGAQTETEDVLRQKVAALEAALAAKTSQLAAAHETVSTLHDTVSALTAERNKLRRAYELLKGHLELIRRRIFVAKAERIDTSQLEIEFAETKAKLDQLARVLDDPANSLGAAGATGAANQNDGTNNGRPANKKKKTSTGGGRPDLTKLDLVEERVEITDPSLEGVAERIGFEHTYLLGRRRACNVRVVMAKATYKITSTDADGETTTELRTAPKPREIVDRGMLAPSFIAYLLTKKFRWGMPFHRIALELASEGFSIDDSTMCRYAEHVGATFGCIVDAMWTEAREKAFCISTDATGAAIQPARLDEKTEAATTVREGSLFRRARGQRSRPLRISR